MRSKPRFHKESSYYQVYSKYERFCYNYGFAIDEEWRQWYAKEVKCSLCEWPNEQWQVNPRPLRIVVEGFTPGCSVGALGCPANMISDQLCDALAEYLPSSIVLDRVRLRTSEGIRDAGFRSVQVPRQEWVNPFRGKNSIHRYCASCNQVVGFGDNALVSYDVKDRVVVFDASGNLYIRHEIVEALKLRSRFEDIRLYRIPLLPAPIDGWTLPGDPEWQGVLRVSQIYLDREKRRHEYNRRVQLGEIDPVQEPFD